MRLRLLGSHPKGVGITEVAGTVPAPTRFDRARDVADAVLYEGYLLYPYRRSSTKNRVRWQFGVLAPRSWIEPRGPVEDGVAGSAESWFSQTQVLLEAPEATSVHVRVRFLQLQTRCIEEVDADGAFVPVDALDVDGVRHLTFEEATSREADIVAGIADLTGGGRVVTIGAPAGEDVERLVDRQGRTLGRAVRRRRAVSAAVHLSVQPAVAPFPLRRLQIRVENTVADVPAKVAREEALRQSLVATHTFVALTAGVFLSLLDPPAWAAPAAEACQNLRTFPVLAGEPGSRDLMLSAPIILYDHPQISPESPGDLYDATEIDEILSLRALTLTEDEKREARGTDPRAAAIVDRVDAAPPELMERLHGVIRPAAPWWDPGADASVSPGTDAVVVAGVRVCKGSRVRLHPRRRGTDAHDMFLAGRTAQVEAVLLDVDGSRHIAVTIEDDPGAELHQWYGRFHYYSPDEVEPLGPAAEEAT